MVKFLPVILVVSAMLSVVFYLRFFRVPEPELEKNTALVVQVTPAPVGSRLTPSPAVQVQPAVTAIPSKPPLSAGQSNSSVENRLKALEDTVASLRAQLNTNQQSTQQPTAAPTASKQPPLYIPLSWSATATSLDWTTTTQEVLIDPSDYPGYSGMQLEVSLRAFQGNGRAYARLYNKDDGTAILSSEVSTTSLDYTWLTSSGFTLPGKKTYRLQLKTLTGYEAGVNNARIRVNF